MEIGEMYISMMTTMASIKLVRTVFAVILSGITIYYIASNLTTITVLWSSIPLWITSGSLFLLGAIIETR